MLLEFRSHNSAYRWATLKFNLKMMFVCIFIKFWLFSTVFPYLVSRNTLNQIHDTREATSLQLRWVPDSLNNQNEALLYRKENCSPSDAKLLRQKTDFIFDFRNQVHNKDFVCYTFHSSSNKTFIGFIFRLFICRRLNFSIDSQNKKQFIRIW